MNGYVCVSVCAGTRGGVLFETRAGRSTRRLDRERGRCRSRWAQGVSHSDLYTSTRLTIQAEEPVSLNGVMGCADGCTAVRDVSVESEALRKAMCHVQKRVERSHLRQLVMDVEGRGLPSAPAGGGRRG